MRHAKSRLHHVRLTNVLSARSQRSPAFAPIRQKSGACSGRFGAGCCRTPKRPQEPKTRPCVPSGMTGKSLLGLLDLFLSASGRRLVHAQLFLVLRRFSRADLPSSYRKAAIKSSHSASGRQVTNRNCCRGAAVPAASASYGSSGESIMSTTCRSSCLRPRAE